MMQIDCEVTNTQLLHLQESLIPKHLRPKHSADQASKTEDEQVPTAANFTKNYKSYFLAKENITSSELDVKNYKNPYAMKAKDSYRSKEPAYLLRSKFMPSFGPENSKDDSYGKKSDNYAKPDIFTPDIESSKAAYSQTGKKFRRRRNLPSL